jgi:predicted molibdopterin-dependent oxidoreductase YjgC
MFRLLDETVERVQIEVDDVDVSVPLGVSVAAALLYLDRIPLRHSSLSGAPRAPFCMMGICFECLVEIDGVANQRACQVPVRPGMRLRRQLSTATGADA